MKNLFKRNTLAYLLVGGLLATQISCSSNKETANTSDQTSTTNASGDSETAYNEFRDYVTSVETSTSDTGDSANAARTSANSRAEYDAKLARLNQYNDQYDATRRQEIADLQTRYSTWESQSTSANGGMAVNTNVTGTSVNGGAAADFSTNEVATTSAMNIRMAYENFVNRVASNKDNYSKADWQAAESYFKALDDRKNGVQGQLTDKDKYEIGKAKAKYTALKAGRLGIDASEAGNTVSDNAQEAGSEVKDATKKGASKVGNAAEKAGSQVKSTIKSGAKKIDRKIDDNPNED